MKVAEAPDSSHFFVYLAPMKINHRSDETHDAYYTYETTIDAALNNGVLDTSVTGGWNKRPLENHDLHSNVRAAHTPGIAS